MTMSDEQQFTKFQKKHAERRFLPAGQESTLLSENRKHKIPSINGYSDQTKVYSPFSRCI